MVVDKRPMDDDDNDDDEPRESRRQRRCSSLRKMEVDHQRGGKLRRSNGTMINRKDRCQAVKEQKTQDPLSVPMGAFTSDFVQRLISAMEPLLHETMSPVPPAPQDGDRAGWTTSRDEFFINLLLEQTSRGRRTESGFTKDAWKAIFLTFNKKINLNYTISQLKSRYRRLKTQYRMTKALRSLNGFGWDDELKVVTASEDVWEQYISEHSDARNYKSKYFPFYDQCGILFDGKRVGGRGPTMSMLHNGLMQDDANAATDTMYSTDEASSRDATPYELPEQQKREDTTSSSSQEKRVWLSPRHRIAAALENIAFEFADGRSMQKMVSEDDLSFRQCVLELQNMDGLDPEDCVKAVCILKDPLNRVAFATLNEDLRRRWLFSELDQFK